MDVFKQIISDYESVFFVCFYEAKVLQGRVALASFLESTKYVRSAGTVFYSRITIARKLLYSESRLNSWCPVFTAL